MAVELGTILSGLKILRELAEKYKDPKFNDAYMNLQIKIIDLQQDYIRIKDENEELKRAQEISEKVRFERPYIFLEDDPDPYCQKCFDSTKKFIRVGKRGYWGITETPGRICPECNHIHDEAGDDH